MILWKIQPVLLWGGSKSHTDWAVSLHEPRNGPVVMVLWAIPHVWLGQQWPRLDTEATDIPTGQLSWGHLYGSHTAHTNQKHLHRCIITDKKKNAPWVQCYGNILLTINWSKVCTYPWYNSLRTKKTECIMCVYKVSFSECSCTQ